ADPSDLAGVASAALLDARHDGRTYVLAGPATSPRERAAAIGAALGEPVTFAEVTRDQAHEQMARWMPADVADDTLTILGNPTTEEAAVGTDLTTVLGRPARTFAAWAEENAEAFR